MATVYRRGFNLKALADADVADFWRFMLEEAACALWQRLLGQPASESGTLCHEGGTHRRSDRCRRRFMLPIISSR